MREFILYSRLGRTNSNFENLHDGGRLDIVHECIISSLFLSHGIRKNVVFHAVLNGPPSPPLHLEIEGEYLRNVRTDIHTWHEILKRVLSGRNHPGVSLCKTGFEALLRAKAEKSEIYVLEEGGKDIAETEISANPVFVLGDHVGLPRKAEIFALRYGMKISLGRIPYLAASCITILNYVLDLQSKTTK